MRSVPVSQLRLARRAPRLARHALPFVVLTAALTLGFASIAVANPAPVAPTTQTEHQANLHPYGGVKPSPCGAQLGFAGFSATLKLGAAAASLQTSLALNSGDIAAEFAPLTASAPALTADSAAKAVGLERMQLVHSDQFIGSSRSAVIAKLQHQPSVEAGEEVWLQSSDKRYLSCHYKLADNATDQTLAGKARQALITGGISASMLDDAGTMEFVSLRHFDGQLRLQTAFVRRPVGQPSVAYVAVMNPGTETVLATAQANWYRWE